MKWNEFIKQEAKLNQWQDIPRLFYIFLRIAESHYIGRYQLMRELTITEAVIKTMLEKLKKANLIIAEPKRGHILSPFGLEIYNSFRTDIPTILRDDFGNITLFRKDSLFLVRNRADKISNGLKQRDIALISCKDFNIGVTTLIVKRNNILIPPENIVIKEKYPEAYQKISKLDLRNNDVIIIGSSYDTNKAFLAGLSAILDLFSILDS